MTALAQHQPDAPKRLLAINNYFYRRGGAETVFFDQMAMFAEIGWDVVPFAMQHEANQPSPWSKYFVSEIEYGRASSPLRKLTQAASILYSFEAQRNIARLIAQARPSVAHAHNVYHHLSPAIFATLKDAGIPVVMTAHDLKLACPAYKMLRDAKPCEDCKGGHVYNVLRHRCIKDSIPLSGLVLAETLLHRGLGLYRNKIDRIVVPSRFYVEKLVEWNWPREQLRYIPNFVDVAAFQSAWDEGDYFVFAGRLAPEKGLATLIRAVARAKQRLIVAGTGPEETALRQLVSERDADVSFVGHLAGADLHRLIGQSRALVLPSEWYENAPLSILEAYALGRPVIGAAIGGIPEMVRDGETGLLARPGDVDDLADKLGQLAALSVAQRAQMGDSGRQWIAQEFSAQAYRDRTLALYAELGAA
ncbi:glycosyltransferase involved in cell wall biosynthesis [Rhodopseudomonas rhenobacensis]|uniref:Glycosyltransferase involved in cell wall biosynthesis n=1 Tax=Rhodopseudomonas rhenobacensis TaxID=87461 RepID=A0A7W7Z7E9_9BRAD|nr:glycosyltransferase family 4 protein [Rhodopseudomonas rhenobacensis]MBB5049374.1 glycosyltransferase involved in cell wall biosynthesis [Rhodopseudomonas rhenobacensis]